MKCTIFMIAMTILWVDASPTIHVSHSEATHLSAKTANIDEKNYVKRSITTKQYRLVDVPARINRLIDNASKRSINDNFKNEELTIRANRTVAGNSTCASPEQRMLNIMETAINNSKKCYQPFKDIALNYPENLKDLQISEEVYNIFESCQPVQKELLLNAVDCVNATMTEQQLSDPRISLLLEKIKNSTTTYLNMKSCEIVVYYNTYNQHLDKMWTEIKKCVEVDKIPRSRIEGGVNNTYFEPMTNSNEEISSEENENDEHEMKVLLLNSEDQQIEDTVPINRLTKASVKVNYIVNNAFNLIEQKYKSVSHPVLHAMNVTITEGPVYSHCIPRSRYNNVLETALRQSKECYQPLLDTAKIYSENIGNIYLSDAMKTVFQNCLPENRVIYKSSVDCVNATMIKQGLIDPKISLLLETIKNSNSSNKGFVDCVTQFKNAAWADVKKMLVHMENCVPVTLMWDVFNAM